ncbi:MAG: cyclase family protein [Alphaproteobacteria bacterium]|nr:cyclase family protein [Alphaproteobacteria bacterium]
MRIVDLSVELADNMVRYPSPYLPPVSVRPAARHEVEARSAQIVTFGTHVSTHLDAPFHSYATGKTIDQIPLAQLCGVARIARIPGKTRANPIDRKDLEGFAWLGSCEKLVLDTGWARATWGGQEYFLEGPYLTRGAAQFLAEQPKLHMIAMDFPNIDKPEETVMGTPAPNHRIILGKEIVLLENLVNLWEVDEQFLLYGAPPRLVGGDGCPARAVAVFPLRDVPAWLGLRS